MEVNEWIQNNSDKFLTIKDIQDLPEGHSIKILFFRGWIDTVRRYIEPTVLYHPAFFFSECTGIFTKEEGLRGTINFNDDVERPFEFSLNYLDDRWHPLRNGELRHYNGDENKHYLNYPLETKVGLRGPAMFWGTVFNSDEHIFRRPDENDD